MKSTLQAKAWRFFGLLSVVLEQKLHSIFRRRLRKVRFRLDAEGNLKFFSLGNGCRFDVPVRVGGGHGEIVIEDGAGFGWLAASYVGKGTILLEPRSLGAKIKVGAETMFSNNVSIIAMRSVIIGKRCLIGELTTIIDCDFHETHPDKRITGVGPIEPVLIADNVWIGSRVLILRGVSIGKNSIVGAGSVVTRNIPANSIAVGVPAKVIKTL